MQGTFSQPWPSLQRCSLSSAFSVPARADCRPTAEAASQARLGPKPGPESRSVELSGYETEAGPRRFRCLDLADVLKSDGIAQVLSQLSDILSLFDPAAGNHHRVRASHPHRSSASRVVASSRQAGRDVPHRVAPSLSSADTTLGRVGTGSTLEPS